MTTYVAWLRGINVGGNHKVNMAELKASFEALGFESVKTYINSGNVIFKASNTKPEGIESAIEQALEKQYGFLIRVVVRTADQIDAVIKGVPKSWLKPDDLRCNVIFLSRSIDKPGILEDVAPKAGVDELHYLPGALLWSASFSDITKSNLSKLVGTPIYKNMTIRIFNTVLKVRELMRQIQ